jgi:predicted nucleotide-binding protein (sugar kinase/HSP70/actin superfamily)
MAASQNEAGPTIGIPRALTFYKQAAMWVSFFSSLGCRTTISTQTTKEILEDGLEHSVDETCLPVKVFIGHIQQLIREHLDFIFVCRQQDFSAQEVLCTKLWGIPDICRNTFTLPAGCKWLELNISPSVDGISDRMAWFKVGRALEKSASSIKRAYRKAIDIQHVYEKLLQSGIMPLQALRLALQGAPDTTGQCVHENAVPNCSDEIQIALVGHPYLIYDEHFGSPLVSMLRRLGVKIRLVEQLNKELCRAHGRDISPHLHWTYNRELVGAAELYMSQGIDGVIFVEAFPCGPDALALDYATRKLRGRKPMMRLVLDELNALTGIQTRLESFLDVIRMRRDEEVGAHA